MNKLFILKSTAVAGIAVIALAGLTACTSLIPESVIKDIPVNNASAELMAPATVDAATLSGQTVTVSSGQMVNIIVPQDNVEDWAGTSNDSEVAQFLPGMISNGVVTDPGFTTSKLGETEATLTNTSTGDVIVFKIVVG